jgi:amino acid adenylation domain-containing protein
MVQFMTINPMPNETVLRSPGPSLAKLFLDAAQQFGERTALEVDSREYTYAELAERAQRIAAVLGEPISREQPLAATLTERSGSAYEAILGVLCAGFGYVPLNSKFPDDRNAYMFATSGATKLVVEAALTNRLEHILAGVDRKIEIIVLDDSDISELAEKFPEHAFRCQTDLEEVKTMPEPPRVDEDSIAYVLFTSGSTGRPKGVMVTHRNVLHFVQAMWDRYGITNGDRFSQTFDLSFDLSVFDMFVCWGRGAALVPVPRKMLMAPDKFIRAKEISVWFSVPSTAMVLRGFRRLKPDAFPSLRLSLFCGERLPIEIARDWQVAAPNSIVENLYGPTEVTIACTLYQWDSESSPAECYEGGVPIGLPYPGLAVAIVDEELKLVPKGEQGELCMNGPQVTAGYIGNAEETNKRFVSMPWHEGPNNRWYRTGDVVHINENGILIYTGRNDDQVKIRGHRMELPEIERAIREASETDFVKVVPFPVGEFGPTGITAVLAHSKKTTPEIVGIVKESLPDYMVPAKFVYIDEMPLNVNGKFDTNAILKHLKEPQK